LIRIRFILLLRRFWRTKARITGHLIIFRSIAGLHRRRSRDAGLGFRFRFGGFIARVTSHLIISITTFLLWWGWRRGI